MKESTRKHVIAGWIAKVAIAVLLAPYVTPFVGTMGWKTQYTYANEYREIGAASQLRLESPKNSFVVELETTSTIEDEDAVAFQVTTPSGTKESGLELAGDEFETGRYFTAPMHFEPVSEIQVTCTGCEKLENPKIHLVALDTRSSVEKFSYEPNGATPKAHAAVNGISVVSRADWGADETLRYKDHPLWKKYYEKQATTTPSDATKAQWAKNAAIEAHLEKNFPEESTINEVIRTENGHSLAWPIEKTKYVHKIVLHHTAENNVKSLSDPELMRSMYYFHTMTRGWGDLGYHFVVGQRGQIYEGRAGGDYNVAAHASWNNRSSVGVSVIGNFEKDVLVKEQQAAIGKLLSALAAKYGIDTNAKRAGHKACGVSEECMSRDFEIQGIVGHRDVGATSCPGANLYRELTDVYIPELNKTTRNNVLIANAVYKPETLKPAVTKPDLTDTNSAAPLSNGPTIRVKLSIPEMKTIELEALSGTPILGWDKKSGQVDHRKISIRKSGAKIETTMGGKKYKTANISLSADVVRVNNWDRVPAWDKEKKYNDNEFRGKLEVRIEGGKLIVINELPLELYLRGLAEFSNGENVEKAKTIIVAARSYAFHYTDPKNRKFPGKPYDGSDDPDVFQKYLGYGYEKRSATTSKYVEETRGQVVAYRGEPIKPWYFSQSSGRTLSALEYCEGRKTRKELPASAVCADIPYLQSVSDPGGDGKSQLGHGVGISGIGATYFASTKGWDHKQIIQYYLKDTEVVKKY